MENHEKSTFWILLVDVFPERGGFPAVTAMCSFPRGQVFRFPKEVAWLDAAGHLFPLIRVGILLQSRTVAR